MKIQPLLTSAPSIDGLLLLPGEAVRSADRKGYPAQSLSGAVEAIARSASMEAALEVVTISFVVQGLSNEATREMQAAFDLRYYAIEGGCILSGSLNQWIRTLVACTGSRSSYECRLLFGGIHMYLTTIACVWQLDTYLNKKIQPDSTYEFKHARL